MTSCGAHSFHFSQVHMCQAVLYYVSPWVKQVVLVDSDSSHEWDALVVQSWSRQTWYGTMEVGEGAAVRTKKGARERIVSRKNAVLTDRFPSFWNMCLPCRSHRSKHVMEAGNEAVAHKKRGARKANAPRRCLLLTSTMPSLNASRASLGKDARSDDEIIRVS